MPRQKHKTKFFKKGLTGGFKPGYTGSKPSGKIKKAAKNIKRKVDSKASEVKRDVKSKVSEVKSKVSEVKAKREIKKNPPKKEKVYNPSTYSQSGTGDMDSRTGELSDMLSGASMKKFPEIKEKNEGKFTKWVEKNMGGMDTCKAASKIMRSRTKKYSPAVVKMANYANNFGCKTKREDGASMKSRIPDSRIRSKTTINQDQEKGKFKSKSRKTIESHDIEGNKKGVKTYIDTNQKTKGGKSKFKQFAGTEGEKGYVRSINRRGKETERRTTKGGTKRRIKKAEKNIKYI